MTEKPQVIATVGGVYWENTYEDFGVKVYTPDYSVPADIINYSFETPYVIVLVEKGKSIEELVAFAEAEKLVPVIRQYGGPIVFVYPLCEGGWKNAPADIYSKVINESRTGQYHENGYLTQYQFRTKNVDGYYIRGAVHRPMLFGVGEAADYIALNCIKKAEGRFLWGPGEVTPVACVMKEAAVLPEIERDDILVGSVGNSAEFNASLSGKVKNLSIDEAENFGELLDSYKLYRRILGNLEKQQDLSKLGMVVEPGWETVKTSPDNGGDDKDTEEHKVGYVVYCNKTALTSGENLPTVMAFHGGGDSAMIIGNFSSGWDLVANKYDFLLICVENHLNSTATETVELIEKLKKKYPIDSEKIYATGFSMGGIKSWDMYQEFPNYFTAVAPMSATTEPGFNVSFGKSIRLNQDTILPVFYVGGAMSPLPELSKHAEKCFQRLTYVLEVNKCKKEVNVKYDDPSTWEDEIWALKGDTTIKLNSYQKAGRVMTLELFDSADGKCYTVFGSINDQQHELHQHQCEYAYRFMSSFRRNKNGNLIGGDKDEIVNNALSAELE